MNGSGVIGNYEKAYSYVLMAAALVRADEKVLREKVKVELEGKLPQSLILSLQNEVLKAFEQSSGKNRPPSSFIRTDAQRNIGFTSGE